ncbi:hypothetical protein PybrP1_005965 [[Pythium] brassicae (nom. inval.)]|nr:hypothetical protein PybrP1_005965 [[Pythium] brassicae (nom. inval.)]
MVPPSVVLPPRIAETTLKLKLLEARVRLNGVWLTLLSKDKLEEDEDPTDIGSVVRDEAALLKYQLRIPVTGVEVDVVEQMISGAGDEIVSLARQTAGKLDAKAAVAAMLSPPVVDAQVAHSVSETESARILEATAQAAAQVEAVDAVNGVDATRAEAADKLREAQAAAEAAVASLKVASAQAHEAALKAASPTCCPTPMNLEELRCAKLKAEMTAGEKHDRLAAAQRISV